MPRRGRGGGISKIISRQFQLLTYPPPSLPSLPFLTLRALRLDLFDSRRRLLFNFALTVTRILEFSLPALPLFRTGSLIRLLPAAKLGNLGLKLSLTWLVAVDSWVLDTLRIHHETSQEVL